MAKNRPVIIWIIKQIPRSDPKFHHDLMLVGVGRSIRAPLAIFISGCIVRIGLFIYFLCRRGPFEMLVIFATTISVISRYKAIRIVNIPFG
jgi:hypothetical protein